MTLEIRKNLGNREPVRLRAGSSALPMKHLLRASSPWESLTPPHRHTHRVQGRVLYHREGLLNMGRHHLAPPRSSSTPRAARSRRSQRAPQHRHQHGNFDLRITSKTYFHIETLCLEIKFKYFIP
ncbi:hypothetical protein B566_EDAN001982 [Ephemera danica]|nr:hypothetical protein B566_EDAN001982 [Ephemera danica]